MALTKEERKRRAELLAKGLKVCSKCGRELPVEQFSKCKTRKSGLQPECKECKKIIQSKYNKSEKGKQAQSKALSKYNKSEKGKQAQSKYDKSEKGQIAHFNGNAKRRKREEAQGAGINKEQWLEMMQFFDWKCAYSGVLVNTKNNRSIDHIIPIVKGGEHEVWNCVPMDKNLNRSKKDKDMMEWYTAQDFYSKEKLDKILAWQQYAYNKWSNTKEAQ